MTDPTGEDRRRKNFANRLRRRFVHDRARSERPVRRVDLDRDIVIAAMMVVIVLVGLLATVSLYQQHLIKRQQGGISANQRKINHQQARLARLEKRDRLNAYQTAYRFCTRINVTRAGIHWLASTQIVALSRPSRKARARRFAGRYIAKFERKEGMPILDCSPNTTGGPATYQPSKKQRRFVRRWATGKLTPAEIGICRIRIATLTDPSACLKP